MSRSSMLAVSVPKRRPMFLVPLAFVSVALLIALGGAAWAAGTRTVGVVHLYAASTALDRSLDTEIYTGAVTDHGTDHEGNGINRVVLSKGSFEINLKRLESKLATPIDPNTCSFQGSVTAPVAIVEGTGTGAYRGISGTIEVTATEAGVDPRLEDGECNSNVSNYPGVLLAKGSGVVAYK